MQQLKYQIVPYTRGRGLEVNPNPEIGKLYEHFIGVDEDQLYLFAGAVMDFAFSSKVKNGCVKDLWRVIKPGGHLVLYVGDGRVISPIEKGFDLVVSKRMEDKEFVVMRKRSDKKVNLSLNKRPDKSVCIVRYGGIGDMIQTSSIFPGLKEQGYYIVLNTDPAGYEIVKHDPHIDEFIIQDKAQVPNNELGPYWKILQKDFSKFVNLCESVEGTLLALPGRMPYHWPKEIRHRYMNVNYMEHIHALAGVPLPPKDRFFPTPKELMWAEKQRGKIKGKVILWTLAGSSVHKTWPFLDQIIARIMLEYRDVYVVMVGDGLCQMLESGWEAEPRVLLRSGVWSVRQTLTFAGMSDLVIGPETGVMASVAMKEVPKIIFMSHASVENLTKYWINCTSMEPQGCGCYPCHQLHYGYDPCPRNIEHGVAECQVRIDPDSVWDNIKNIMVK